MSRTRSPPHVLIQLFILVYMFHMNGHDVCSAFSRYPNPMMDPELCNRSRKSFICNPDGVLTQGEAEKLDHLAFNLRRSTLCVCPKCNSRNLGASFGVFIMRNLTENSENVAAIAKRLRKEWRLGTCEDDIIIVAEAETKQAAFDMGSAVKSVITRPVGENIFNECAVHFENNNFYQGLESMVNSYHDILRRLQRPRPKPNRNNLSLILGISLGVIALILFIAALLIALKHRRITRQTSSKRRRYQKRKTKNNNETSFSTKSHNFEYHLCSVADETPKNLNTFDDDSENTYRNKTSTFDPSSMLTVPQVRTKRQLSDVAEETEEDSDSSSRTRMNSFQTGRKLQITEL